MSTNNARLELVSLSMMYIEQWDLMLIKLLRFLLIKSNESVTEARRRSTQFVNDVH